jgi:hypothetical protein
MSKKNVNVKTDQMQDQQGQFISSLAVTNVINNQAQEIVSLKLAVEEMKIQMDMWRSKAIDLQQGIDQEKHGQKDAKKK